MELPTKKNYDSFVDEFAGAICKVQPDTCFYLFGSYIDGRADFGRSDIDGGIILNDNIVTDTKKIKQLSSILAKCLSKNKVLIQFNLSDRKTNKDGRFMSYTKDYTDWFKQKAKVLAGQDYLQEMNGLDFKSGVLYSAAFNLRELRNNSLEAGFINANNPIQFRKNFEKSLEITASFPKKLIWLVSRQMFEKRGEAAKELKKIFPDLELSSLDNINEFLRNPEAIYSLADNYEQASNISLLALTQTEEMIEAYLSKFPNVNKREARE